MKACYMYTVDSCMGETRGTLDDEQEGKSEVYHDDEL